MNKFKKVLLLAVLLPMMIFAITACGGKGGSDSKTDSKSGAGEKKDVVKATMITDQGGVNDKSFNQSAFEGLTQAKKEGWLDFRYLESHKEADYAPNLENALDDQSDVIFTIGYALYNATEEAAKGNKDQRYCIIDNANVKKTPNLLGIVFADNENSFLVGYIAGMKSKTNNVGFVGGMKSNVIDRFEYGFKAGVRQAAREKGKEIQVQSQYADSYADAEKGKAIANQMYQKGADVIFHASGGTGDGVIQSAVENNKWVIGVDRDQSDQAPKNMLVSTIKGVNTAVMNVAKEVKEGKFKGGETLTFGLKDGEAATIKYAKNDLVSKEIKDKTEKIRKEVIDGKIKVPENEKQFKEMGYDK